MPMVRLLDGNFNPRPPQGERHVWEYYNGGEVPFQSTPPARGATMSCRATATTSETFQSTPPARGATMRTEASQRLYSNFNPRPPQGERPDSISFGKYSLIFQSTPPARGATVRVVAYQPDAIISIHAPRKGSDDQQLTLVHH